jgi:hypothetical protein
MSEQETQYKQKLGSWRRNILLIFPCIIVANVVKELGWLPYIAGYALAYGVFLLIDYWIPPRPPIRFTAWAVKIAGLMLALLLGLWVIPSLLSRWTWASLAYAIPTFVLFVSMYWIPPLYPVRREDSFRKHLLVSLVFATAMGVAGYFVAQISDRQLR